MTRFEFLKFFGALGTVPALSHAQSLPGAAKRPASPRSGGGRGWARPLAQSFVAIAQSPQPGIFVGSPTIVALPTGRLLASYEWFVHESGIKLPADHAEVSASDDQGLTWRRLSTHSLGWASLFCVNGTAHLIGHVPKTQGIAIVRSNNDGATWSNPSVLFPGKFTGAPTSVVFRNGFVYRAFEEGSGPPDRWQSLVVAGDTRRDLMDASAWRMSNHVPYPGTPDSLARRLYPPGKRYRVPPDGWLEGNVFAGRNGLNVLLRVRIDGMTTAGLGAVCDLKDDGQTMIYRFGQFYPMPGGQGKFHVVHDRESDFYWAVATIPTDTFAQADGFVERGFFGVPGNERRVLVLNYSLDGFNWFQAGCVAMSANPLEAFSYGSLLPYGDDMLVIARTSLEGRNQHDTNLITLHRVKDFRRLALDLRRDFKASAR